MRDFSAVVPSWRRVANLRPIAENLLAQPFVDDIVIWHNDPDRPLAASEVCDEPGRVTVHNATENVYTWGRFLAARFCRHDWILTCDDDNLVHNWSRIAKAFREAPGRIICALPPDSFLPLYADHLRSLGIHETLLGWGAAFDRRWIEPAFASYRGEWGEDEVLRRKADRLFGLLRSGPHKLIASDHTRLPGDSKDGIALCKRPDHMRLTAEARCRAKAQSRSKA